ncbi:unnamed protein product [marine sediment metagenome]|uniref:Uncharacterized protein n=1 Tax=marine sediment metagenome TaxID=412755 RepID=X1C9K3_9ZZZZ
MPTSTDDAITYYAGHGIISDPGRFARLYDNLPQDMASCVLLAGIYLRYVGYWNDVRNGWGNDIRCAWIDRIVSHCLNARTCNLGNDCIG